MEYVNERPDWPLPSFDAQDWAQAFCKIADKLGFKDNAGNPIDEGWMIGWFANALMRGYGQRVSDEVSNEREMRRRCANEEVEAAMIPKIVDAIYPVLIPMERQDCSIQSKNYALMTDLAKQLWRSFTEPGGGP
jgi:hypothetical protein